MQGRFWVHYGPKLTRTKERQNPDGIPEIWFGHDCVTGDLNGDGYDDLAVSAPQAANEYEHEYGDGSGVVWIYWGPKLKTSDARRLTNLPFDEGGGMFGHRLETIDFDGDGSLDLLVGAPNTKRSEPDGDKVGGEVDVLYGPDLEQRSRIIHPWIDGQNGQLGFRFNVGDLTADGQPEIVSGHAAPDKVWVIDVSGSEAFRSYRSRKGDAPELILHGAGDPRPGRPFELLLDGARFHERPLLFSSPQADAVRLDGDLQIGSEYGGPRFLLLAQPLTLRGAMVPSEDFGLFTFARPYLVPPHGDLVGTRIRFQAFLQDPGDPLGFRESNGLTVTVQGEGGR